MTTTIDNLTPADASDVEFNAPISFDVTTDAVNGFASLMVAISFVDGDGESFAEIAHDGSSFRGSYLGPANKRTAITDGFRFTVLRDAGWQGSPTIEIYSAEAAP